MSEFAEQFPNGGDRQLRVVIDTVDDLASPDAWNAWVEAPVRNLLLGLRDRLNGTGVDCATVVIRLRKPQPDVLTGIAAAALEALRGCVGSAALELGPQGVRANLVAVESTADLADVEQTVRYLEDPSDGGYTTGATLHVGAPWSPCTPSLPAGVLPSKGRVLITGAAGGLGLGSARRLAADGYDVLLSDFASDKLDDAATELAAKTYPADVTDGSDLERLATQVATDGPLRALAILHGVGTSGAIKDLSEDVLERSMRINAAAVLQLTQRFASNFDATGGTIVVLSSQAGLYAEQFNSAYCAAKFAAVGLVDGLAAWLATLGVRIHALCPGPIDTPLMRFAFTTMADAAGMTYDEYLDDRLHSVPLRCTGTVEQLAASTALLVALQGTGMVLAPSGGAVLS